jgi:hypothetical protein
MIVLLGSCYLRFGRGAWDSDSSQFPTSRVTGELNPVEMTNYRCDSEESGFPVSA